MVGPRPTGPEDYPYLSPDQIYDLSKERSLTEARAVYKARYGRPCTDKGIDTEIHALFVDWARGYFDENDNQGFELRIEVPPHLLLGLLLREGSGRNRGRLPMTAWEKIARYKGSLRAYQEFKKLRAELKDELIAAGKETSWAANEADEKALRIISERSGLSENAILRPDRKRRPRRPTKRA
jgi:hypothetical protein